MRDYGDRLFDMHNKTDESGRPVWYVPAELAETQSILADLIRGISENQREISETQKSISEMQRKTVDILEKIERRLDVSAAIAEAKDK